MAHAPVAPRQGAGRGGLVPLVTGWEACGARMKRTRGTAVAGGVQVSDLPDCVVSVIEDLVLRHNALRLRLVCKRWRFVSLCRCTRSRFHVPVAQSAKGLGRVRDHFSPILVSRFVFNKIANHPNDLASWPPVADVSPLSVVVVRGVQRGQAAPGFAWYARVKPVSTDPNAAKAVTILRRMPFELCQSLLTEIFKDRLMRRSSLVTAFQPDHENAPVLGEPNGFCSAIGRLRHVPSDVPRFDMEGVSFACVLMV